MLNLSMIMAARIIWSGKKIIKNNLRLLHVYQTNVLPLIKINKHDKDKRSKARQQRDEYM